jgi:hypothetical protein
MVTSIFEHILDFYATGIMKSVERWAVVVAIQSTTMQKIDGNGTTSSEREDLHLPGQ